MSSTTANSSIKCEECDTSFTSQQGLEQHEKYASYRSIPAFEGNITMPIVYGMKMVAQNVQGIIVPNSGHWIPEEQPDFVITLLNNFFSGKPTETSK